MELTNSTNPLIDFADVYGDCRKFIKESTFDSVAYRLATAIIAERKLESTVKAIRTLAQNPEFVMTADLAGVEWAFGRKLRAPEVKPS